MSRRRLQLTNHTAWSTRDLRNFLIAAMHAKGVEYLRVDIRYNRGGGDITGLAEGKWIQLNLPGPKFVHDARTIGLTPLKHYRLAQVTEHEIDHVLGLDHKDMLEWWDLAPTWQAGIQIAWTAQEQKRLSPQERAKRRSAAVEKRAEHAQAMLKKAETRLKRAKTIRDKWAKKVRYYERRRDVAEKE